MKRRVFLRTTLAATASFVAPTILRSAEKKPDPLQRIGMTSSMFRYMYSHSREPGICENAPVP